jgi:crotonobetainyl-CoA:carnitine CoA-transferase CaiB-like acyl-CoA transferase
LTQQALLTRAAAEWLERLTAEDVPCAPVLTRSQVIRNAQVIANETLTETDHIAAGRLRQTRPAARFSATPAGIRFGAPALGEHTEEVLAELGYAPEQIASFKE